MFRIKNKVVVLMLLLSIGSSNVNAKADYHFGFFIPDDTLFWSRVALFAKSAANDLNVKITVFDADANRILMLQQFKKAQKKQSKFDALIFPNFLKTAPIAIKNCEKQQIPCILYNGDISEDRKHQFSTPGNKYKYWIGQLIPDDQGSAAAITDALITKARKVISGPINIVAVNGFNADAPAIKREKGLRNTLQKYPEVNLLQVFYTDWSKEDAYARTLGFLKRYPKTNVIWSANYRTTNGILSALFESNKHPGDDVLLNSYDIDPISLDHIQHDELTVTAGGHYVEGAWAVVMAFDYLKGYKLKIADKTIHTPLLLVTKENINLVKNALIQLEAKPDTLNRADFSKFSLINNPNQKHYDFSLEEILTKIVRH